jgi:Heterokaryon incompatibility protein Het-C/Putative peptidoglycan binding domain
MSSTLDYGPLAPGLAAPPPDRPVTMGHSLLSPATSAVPGAGAAPGVDAFAAGLAGHERVERDSLRAIIGDDRILKAIYFGNWQRDYSQFIPQWFGGLGPRLGPFLGRVMFDVFDVVAQSEFGQRLDRVRFGTYRWEEHIDNPRNFGLALDPKTYQTVARRRPADEPDRHLDLWQEDNRGILRYFRHSRDYAVGRLGDALSSRRGLRGYEHLGAALHTIEDLFAHSNFVEIAILALGGRAEPMTGTIAATGEPIRDLLGRYRLTTGVFLTKDSISSISKILLTHVEGVPSTPAAASIKEVLIGRFLGPTALAVYRRLVPQHSQHPPGRLVQALEERLLTPLRIAIATALHPAAERFARQTGREPFIGFAGGRRVTIIETSHSLVAKDDGRRPYHPVARRLAGIAVAEIWHEMERSWRSGVTDVHRTALPALVDKYINHPQAGEPWWAPTVRPLLAAPPLPGPGQPGSAAPAHGRAGLRPVLRRGSRGAWVRVLQQLLNNWLAHGPGRRLLVLDGIFGPQTQAAVVAFQRGKSLSVDGVVGRQTWAALQTARGPGKPRRG